MDVDGCLPTVLCEASVGYVMAVCRAISVHAVAGQLLHHLLMELFTGSKLK